MYDYRKVYMTKSAAWYDDPDNVKRVAGTGIGALLGGSLGAIRGKGTALAGMLGGGVLGLGAGDLYADDSYIKKALKGDKAPSKEPANKETASADGADTKVIPADTKADKAPEAKQPDKEQPKNSEAEQSDKGQPTKNEDGKQDKDKADSKSRSFKDKALAAYNDIPRWRTRTAYTLSGAVAGDKLVGALNRNEQRRNALKIIAPDSYNTTNIGKRQLSIGPIQTRFEKRYWEAVNGNKKIQVPEGVNAMINSAPKDKQKIMLKALAKTRPGFFKRLLRRGLGTGAGAYAGYKLGDLVDNYIRQDLSR